MRIEEISRELKEAAFDYFYWFSRFEFALKERGFLKSKEEGKTAVPDWTAFKKEYSDVYEITDDAKLLVELHPKRQVIGAGGGLDWRPVGLEHCNNDLCNVVTMLTTIRNNLFHGGKHGDKEIDDVARNILLLKTAGRVLKELAQTAEFQGDYDRYY
ncbi:hypothetical protein [Serratia fonticola]|uniref:hypothetical protein n=1 Tax=Serratia fonticola TaxID=47917 RepID=UPI000E0E5359|nr:hypothetical protein [Serratia fonticola]RDL16437.1 hypothetical protein DFO62_12015 [Serratia fonticola]